MTNYFLSIASFQTKALEAIKPALESPTLSKIVFPSELPTSSQKSIHFQKSSEFDISLLPNEFISSDNLVAVVPLYCSNGIKFSSTIYINQETIIPNILSIEFTTIHLERNIISLPIIKRLLNEIIPIFDVDQASVQDKYSKIIPHKGGGHGFEKVKYYQTKKGIYYQLEIGWINYFGIRMIKEIGRERFTNLHSFVEMYDLYNGILTVLQQEPMDKNNQFHMERKMKAEKELGFYKIQKK